MDLINMIYEQILNDFETLPIFDVSYTRSPILKEIETNFENYKIKKDKIYLKDLEKNIKLFTSINKVNLIIKKDTLDACVLPSYKKTLPIIFKNDNENKLELNKLKVDKIKASESAQYIEKIDIVLGSKIIDMFNSKELTAILLHEIGHVYQHTSNMSLIIPKIISTVSKFSSKVSFLVFLKTLFFAPVSSLYIFPLTLTIFTLSRTLTFKEHLGELDADKYAAKYGYGDELAKVFFVFNKKWGHNKVRPNTWFKKVWDSIKHFFTLKTHPDDLTRVCELIKSVKVDYKNKYPKLKKEITVIYADINC